MSDGKCPDIYDCRLGDDEYVLLRKAVDLLPLLVDVAEVVLRKQGGLTNEKNNMMFNLTGLIHNAKEALRELTELDRAERGRG